MCLGVDKLVRWNREIVAGVLDDVSDAHVVRGDRTVELLVLSTHAEINEPWMIVDVARETRV